MQGVGGKGFAGMSLRRLAQRSRAVPVDDDRTDDDGDGPPGHRDIAVAGDQARQRLVDDPGGGEEQETGLDQRGDAFGLGMAEMMRVVRRPIGEAHRRIGDGRGTEIDERMDRLRQDRQGTGDGAGDEFGGSEEGACRERNERYSLLVGYHASPPSPGG